MLLCQTDKVGQLLESVFDRPGLLAFGIIVTIILSAASAYSERVRLVGIGLLLWLASLERPIETRYYSLAMTPWLQLLSSNARVLSVAMLAGLSLGSIFCGERGRKNIFPMTLVTLLSFQLLNCVKMLSEDDAVRFLATVPVVIAIFILTSIGVGRALTSPRGVENTLWAVMLSGILFVGGTLHEVLLNSSSVFANGRLYGTTYNPQPAGMMCVMLGLTATYLLVHDRRHYLAKPLLFGMLVLLGVGLIATGSRTALLSAAVGFAVMLRSKALISIAIVGLLVYTVINASSGIAEIEASRNRLLSYEDTRSESWIALINDFKRNPVFGGASFGSGTAESSYLGVAARLGLVGIAFFGAFCVATLGMIFKLLTRARSNSQHTAGELVVALVLSFATSCFFDAYIFGSVSWHLIVTGIALAIGSYIVEQSDAVHATRSMHSRSVRSYASSEPT